MVRKHNMLHETIVRDIFDVVKGLKNEDEVQRIVNVFNLVHKQNLEFKGSAVVNYANLDLIPCEN